MHRTGRFWGALVAIGVSTPACAYPDFDFRTEPSEGSAASGGGVASGGGAAADAGPSTSTGARGAGGGGGDGGGAPGCALDHLVIGEVRTRGVSGGNDEFVELYNPLPTPVTLDETWTLAYRRMDAPGEFELRWTGSGAEIPAGGHFLIAGLAYEQLPPGDGALSSGIGDAAALQLRQGGARVDALCFYAMGTAPAFAAGDCEGDPAENPHDDTSGTNANASLERKPGGASGSCVDTDHNDADFLPREPSTPTNADGQTG